MAAIPAVFLAMALFLLTACGGDADSSKEPAQAPAKPFDPHQTGVIAGKVLFRGTSPPLVYTDMQTDPNCAARFAAPVPMGNFVTSRSGELKNVAVTIKSGLEKWTLPVSDTPVVIDQVNCLYEPRVVIMPPGNLAIRSSDNTFHNVRSHTEKNEPFSITLPLPTTVIREFMNEEIVSLTCDMHPWMKGIVIVRNTLGDVSNEFGDYAITGVPPGDYTIEAWHEDLGSLEATLKVREGQTTRADFEFTR